MPAWELTMIRSGYRERKAAARKLQNDSQSYREKSAADDLSPQTARAPVARARSRASSLAGPM